MEGKIPSSRGPTVGRRAVLGAMGFTPLLALVPRSAVAGALSRPGPLRYFDDHAAAVVTEATARLIPGPLDDPEEAGHPGAREAGVVFFIDIMLSAFDDDPPRIFAGGPWSDRAGSETDDFASFIPLTTDQETQWRRRIDGVRALYAEGIAALDAAAGGDFTVVTPQRRDEILTASTDFRRVLFEHAIEGMYSAPEYGGNDALVGWQEIGYAGDVAAAGFTAAEVSESDGPDPSPPEVPLPYAPAAHRLTDQPTAVPAVARSANREPLVAVPGLAAPGAAATAPGEDFDAAIDDLGAFLAAALAGLGRQRYGRG